MLLKVYKSLDHETILSFISVVKYWDGFRVLLSSKYLVFSRLNTKAILLGQCLILQYIYFTSCLVSTQYDAVCLSEILKSP